MKFMKRGLAVFLAALLMLPAQPSMMVSAELSQKAAAGQEIVMEEMTEAIPEADQTQESSQEKTDPNSGKEESDEREESVRSEESSETEESSESEEGSETEESAESEEGAETEESSESEEGSETEERAETEERSETEENTESEEGSETEENAGSEESSETEKDSELGETSEVKESSAAEESAEPEKGSEIKEVFEAQNPGKQTGFLKAETATPYQAARKNMDEVRFNTGNHVFCVVTQEAFDEGRGDAWFEEDGSYTINIPEENPFFPYEVQFIYKGRTENRWFMTPDDSVEIGDHTFYVSAFFDGSVVTQMSLEVGGNTVVAYPEEKEFTDGDGAEAMSLLPLEERRLNLDLRGYSPIDLSAVSMKSIFTGDNALKNTDYVLWSYGWDGDDYSGGGGQNSLDDTIDLSCGTRDRTETHWQMIVGADSQLSSGNIRYLVTTRVTKSKEWIKPIVLWDNNGTQTQIPVLEDSSGYYDSSYGYLRRLRIRIAGTRAEWKNEYDNLSIKLDVDNTLFEKSPGDLQISGYTGQGYLDMSPILDQGYPLDQLNRQFITLAHTSTPSEFYPNLSVRIEVSFSADYVSVEGLYGQDRRKQIWDSSNETYNYDEDDDCTYLSYMMKYGYAVDDEYDLVMNYTKGNTESLSSVTAAYVGNYSSKEEAVGAGASDIKSSLFDQSESGGYRADYSKGVYFTIFAVGSDGKETCYHYCIRTEKGAVTLNDGTIVNFFGLKDSCGALIKNYIVKTDEDSYGDYNYLTILVDTDTDLTNLAPEFDLAEGVHLYTEGSRLPEVSGESVHDFSKGPVQYTASAENGSDAKNYWLQIVKPSQGEGKLYINSLADEKAETEIRDGILYSTREMLLDGRYDYKHDLLLINMGTEPIENITVELASDEEVYLDNYWTLVRSGYSLAGFSTLRKTTSYGELPNMAKLRFYSDFEDGRDISGTLTIKSGDRVLAVLTLTGTAGDPGITTEEIPDAVKYVPYGTMIQNSNKYSWNTVKYRLEGELPGGMILKPNGELYGVPTETGDFTFTVLMENSYGEFADSERTFTLRVTENTDANVDGATDTGYELTRRIPDISLNSNEDHTMISEGIYEEFVDVFLDGRKLTRDVEYSAESGSTRITIRSQTLKDSNTPGTHTLGIEFRTKDTNTLKRAAQNYRVTGSSSTNTGNSTGDGDSDRDSGTANSKKSRITRDPKKGYMHPDTGIITGSGTGYSHWEKDDIGWKLIYADGTAAAGTMVQQENKEDVEQVLWEKVNNAWYAFGAGGYLKSGWIYDYRLRSWYLISENHGMKSGWYTDAQDRQTYYLEPETGSLATGWKNITNKWYYFNSVSLAPTWELDRETGNWFYNARSGGKPYGALYRNGKTPDRYYVDQEGVWDGNNKQ